MILNRAQGHLVSLDNSFSCCTGFFLGTPTVGNASPRKCEAEWTYVYSVSNGPGSVLRKMCGFSSYSTLENDERHEPKVLYRVPLVNQPGTDTERSDVYYVSPKPFANSRRRNLTHNTFCDSPTLLK